MHYYCAYGEQATDMGLLPTNLKELPEDASFERVATLPLKALRNLTKIFADSKPLRQTYQLSVDVAALKVSKRRFTLWRAKPFGIAMFSPPYLFSVMNASSLLPFTR